MEREKGDSGSAENRKLQTRRSRETRQWIDGKPLYKEDYTFNSLPKRAAPKNHCKVQTALVALKYQIEPRQWMD